MVNNIYFDIFILYLIYLIFFFICLLYIFLLTSFIFKVVISLLPLSGNIVHALHNSEIVQNKKNSIQIDPIL